MLIFIYRWGFYHYRCAHDNYLHAKSDQKKMTLYAFAILCKEVLKEVTVLLQPEIAKYQSTCYGLFMSVLICKVNSDLVMMYNAKINNYLMCR